MLLSVGQGQILRCTDDGMNLVLRKVRGVGGAADETVSCPADTVEGFGDGVADVAICTSDENFGHVAYSEVECQDIL